MDTGYRMVGGEALRVLAAGGVLLSGVVHLELWAEGFRQTAVVGPLFLLNAVGGLVVALAVLAWRHWLPALAAAGFGAATLAAFLVSVYRGLFGVHEQFAGVPQQLALWSEGVAIGCGLAVAVLESVRRRVNRRASPTVSG